MGSTEGCVYGPQYLADDGDTRYFYWGPPGRGYYMREAGTDLWEMVLQRHPEFDDCAPIFATFPQLDEFATKDLYSKHPNKPNQWRHEGRTDDMVRSSC